MPSPLGNQIWQLLEEAEIPDVEKLTQSVFESFSLIERWYLAQPQMEHLIVKQTVDDIAIQAKTYFRAITASIVTAESGHTFAGDAIALCKLLVDGKDSPEDLRQFLSSMIRIAKHAHMQSEETEEQFRKIRTGLMQVSSNIAASVEKIALAQHQPLDVVKSADFVSLPTPVRNLYPTYTGRDMVKKSLVDVEAELEQAQHDLDRLLLSASHFCNWWAKMTTDLGSLESVTPQILPHGSNPNRASKVLNRWQNVQNQYSQYVMQIKLIQDLHPKVKVDRYGDRQHPTSKAEYQTRHEMVRQPSCCVVC